MKESDQRKLGDFLLKLDNVSEEKTSAISARLQARSARTFPFPQVEILVKILYAMF